MQDITGAKVVQIRISEDGTVVWVNTEENCVLRVCRAEKVVIDDMRPKKATLGQLAYRNRGKKKD